MRKLSPAGVFILQTTQSQPRFVIHKAMSRALACGPGPCRPLLTWPSEASWRRPAGRAAGRACGRAPRGPACACAALHNS